MAEATWNESVETFAAVLTKLSVQDAGGRNVPVDEGFARWVELTLTLKKNRGIIYLIGNGASASMASHMAADLAKNGRLHTEVLTDQSLISALSNDISYEDVFSDPLSVRAREGDMLVAISSSGGSPNILKGVAEAKKHGMSVVTLSGMKEGNPLRASGTLNFYLPAETYGAAESTHAAVLHHWMDKIEAHAKAKG
jgi:D-sedoheptulose 7-phosphate isomerase